MRNKQLYAGHDLEMIKKAVEVQRKATTNIGDLWYFSGYGFGNIIYWTHCLDCQSNTEKAFYFRLNASKTTANNIILLQDLKISGVWLPSLSQLIEMVVDEKWGCDKLVVLLNNYVCWYRANGISNWTFEQNWLSYVMLIKFSKTWSDTDWE